MSEYVTALTAAGSGVAVGLVAMARSWPTTNPAKHRAMDRLPSEEVLCGPPDPYTDPHADTQPFGVLRTGFGWCPDCQSTTAGVISRNGFRCGEFAQHPAGGA